MSTDDAMEFLRHVWGDRRGFGHLAAGHDPHVTDGGSVGFAKFTEQSILWPDEQDRAAEWIEANALRDTYFTPELSGNPIRTRSKRKALPTSWVRVDLDHDRSVPELIALVRTLGGAVVASGRPGYRHVYLQLEDEVIPEVAEELNRRLVARFDGDPAPVWHGAYMRLPAGVNTKRPTLGEADDNDTPELLELNNGSGIKPEEIRYACPEMTAASATPVGLAVADAIEPDILPKLLVKLRDERVTSDMDRSKSSYALLAECVAARLTDEQALAVALKHAPSTSKYGAGERLAQEVARSLSKLRQEVAAFDDLAHETRPTQPKPRAKLGTSNASPEAALAACRSTFGKWLHTRDHRVLHAVLAAYVANHLDGDPVWSLVVGPPLSAKTEHLQPLARRADVHPAATLTEASLLSGTPKKEAKGARGGLLRVVGDYGILLLKHFTSVLAQNRDTRAQVLGALREIYDGSWTRHVGTDGGRTLDWQGKLGLIGGCTPAIDQHHAVLSALGDRFMLLRLPEVDPDELTRTALRHLGREAEMRDELALAASSAIEAADLSRATRTLSTAEEDRLRERAIFAVRARSAVTRDGYSQEVLSIPEPEGPPRFLLGLRRLLGSLEAIGCSTAEAWEVIDAVALDSMPATRRRLLAALMGATEPTKTAPLATATDLPTRTAQQASMTHRGLRARFLASFSDVALAKVLLDRAAPGDGNRASELTVAALAVADEAGYGYVQRSAQAILRSTC